MYSKVILFVVLIVSVALLLISLPHRSIFIDDHWVGEQAYWLARQGVVRSELFRGLLDYDIQQLVYQKLQVWQAALIFYTFGFSAYAIKSVNLVLLSIFFFVLFFYFKNHYSNKVSVKYFYVALTVLITNAFLVEQSFNYRPEIAMMLFGFLSFIALRAALKNSCEMSWLLLSAVIAGVTVIYHLIGIVFILSALVLLVIEKRYKAVILYSIVSGLISSIYLADVIYSGSYAQFLYQLKNDPAVNSVDTSYLQRIMNVLLEFKHLFHKVTEGTYSLLFIVLIIFNWRAINENAETKFVFRYFLLLFFILIIFFPGKRSPNHYLMLHMPYVAILISYSFYRMFNQSGKIKATVITLSSLYILSNYAYTLALINQHKPTLYTNSVMMNALDIKAGESVAGPISLVFNEIEQRKLYAVRTYFIKTDKGFTELSVDAFFTDMAEKDNEHIILPVSYAEKLKLTEPAKIIDRFGYRYVREYQDVDRNYYVFRRNRQVPR